MTTGGRVLVQGAGAVAAAAGALLAGVPGARVRAASRRESVLLTAIAPDGAPAHVPVVRYEDVEPGTVDLLILTSRPARWPTPSPGRSRPWGRRSSA